MRNSHRVTMQRDIFVTHQSTNFDLLDTKNPPSSVDGGLWKDCDGFSNTKTRLFDSWLVLILDETAILYVLNLFCISVYLHIQKQATKSCVASWTTVL